MMPKQIKIQHIVVSEDGTLKYDFMTSLQNIAMAKIGSSLWANQNTQQEITDLVKSHNHAVWKAWKEIENSVVAKVSQLFLPNYISEKLKDILPDLGQSISAWIGYHDRHIFYTDEFSEYSAVDQIKNITWTARGKIHYVQTVRNILSNTDSCLSQDHRYKLACNYCLEDEIVLLAHKYVSKFYLSELAIDEHPVVYFWTAHIIGNTNELNNLPYYKYCYNKPRDRNMSMNEHILQLLLKNDRTFNDVPIRFMWNKLTQVEKDRNITSLITGVRNKDFIFSFLSNLDYDVQQKVFKECSNTVLCDIEWDWWDYFLPTAFHVLNIMDPQCCWRTLKDINWQKHFSNRERGKYAYNLYKTMFKRLWVEGPTHFKDFIILHNSGRELAGLATNLSWEPDTDVTELILNDLTTSQKKYIAFGKYGLERCAYFIKNNKWDSLELFLKKTISSETDSSKLKERLIQEKGREIALHFLNREAFDKFERFLSWAFKSEEDMNTFRKNLKYNSGERHC